MQANGINDDPGIFPATWHTTTLTQKINGFNLFRSYELLLNNKIKSLEYESDF